MKCHLTADKDKHLQFQREVRPPIRIWDLEIDEEDHHPTSDFYQPQTAVHLGSVVAEKDFEWGAVAAHTARKDWSHHPEKKMAMDRPHFEEACHQHHPPVPWVQPSRDQAEGLTEDVLEKDNSAGIWGLGDGMGGSETNCKKSGPMKGCGGSPMLWSERRGLIKLIKLTFLNWMLSMHI